MTCSFTSSSTVFQSYQSDAGWSSMKEIVSQTDQHLVSLSSKNNVFEDKMTKCKSVRPVISFCVERLCAVKSHLRLKKESASSHIPARTARSAGQRLKCRCYFCSYEHMCTLTIIWYRCQATHAPVHPGASNNIYIYVCIREFPSSRA